MRTLESTPSTTTTSPASPPPEEPHRPTLCHLLGYAVPSMIGLMAYNALHIVDMFWVGRIGPEAIASIALFAPIQIIFVSVNGLIGAGSVALISRAYGRGDLDRAAEMIRQNVLAKWTVGAAAGAIGFLVLPWMMPRLGAEEPVTAVGIAYGRILLPFLGFKLGQFTCFTAFRCTGRPQLAMSLMLGAVVVNAVLDPLLIFGWGPVPALGVAGAAWASVIAAVGAFVTGAALLASGITGVRVPMLALRGMDRHTLRTLMRIGAPRGVHNLLRGVANTVIVGLVASYGTLAVAAFGVVSRMIDIGQDMAGGFGLGLGALTGQELGRQRPESASALARMALVMVVAGMSLLVAATIVFARPLASLFFDAPEAIEFAASVIRVLLIAVVPMAASRILDHTFQAGGYTLVPTIVQQGITWLVQMPLIWLAVRRWHTDTMWVWALMVFGRVAVLAGETWLYRRGAWLAWHDEPPQ